MRPLSITGRKSTTPSYPSQLQVEKRALWIFQVLLDADEERHRLAAVDDPVIVGECEVHHRADDDLTIERDWALLDFMHAENARLWGVEDGGRHERAVHAAIRDRERAALHLLDLELAVAGALAEIGDRLLDFRERHALGAAQHRDDEAL